MGCKTKASAKRGRSVQFAASNVVDGDKETYRATDDDILQGSLEFDFGKSQLVKYVLLQEYIRLGQRVRAFNVQIWKDNSWQEVDKATTIGYKRIIRLENPVETQKIRINIEDSRACPLISNIEIY